MNTRSLNPFSTPWAHPPSSRQWQPSIQWAVYESHATAAEQQTPGTQPPGLETECFSTSRENKQQPSPGGGGKLTWFPPGSCWGEGAPPHSSAGQSAVFQLCISTNQIIISCRVEAVRLYVISPLLPVKKPLQRALQMHCIGWAINKQQLKTFLPLEAGFISWKCLRWLKSRDINSEYL